jgi:hypothetical protein
MVWAPDGPLTKKCARCGRPIDGADSVRDTSGDWLHVECSQIAQSRELITESRTRIRRSRETTERTVARIHKRPVGEPSGTSASALERRLATLVREHSSDASCFSCLARLFGAPEYEVRTAAQTLLTRLGWGLRRIKCKECGGSAQALRHRAAPSEEG